MKIKHTSFGKTKLVKASLYGMREEEKPEKILWLDKKEEHAAFVTLYWDKKLAIISRKDWENGKEIG